MAREYISLAKHQFLKTMKKVKNKGNVNPIVLVSFAVTLLIGILITTQIGTAATNMVPTSSTTARAALDNVTSHTAGAWQITSVSPYILGSVIIIGIVSLLISRR